MKNYPRIQELRELHQIKPEQICRLLSISLRTYNNYENGQRLIPPEVLIELADFYNVSTDYLLGRTSGTEPYLARPNMR